MNESERFKIWLRRFTKICLKASFRELRNFCNNSTRYFKLQDLLSIGTLLVTVVMVWTLVQNHETLSQTQRQFEATVTPVIESIQTSNVLQLVNVGSVPVTNMTFVARILANYSWNNIGHLKDYRLQNYQRLIALELEQGKRVQFNLSTIITNRFGVYNDGLECYCLVFRYFREADMKPEYKFIYFYRYVYTVSADFSKPIYVYKPIGIGETLIDGNEIPLGQIRPDLRNYALEQLDLPGYDDEKR